MNKTEEVYDNLMQNLSDNINKWNKIIQDCTSNPDELNDENLIKASFYDGMLQLGIALMIGYSFDELNQKTNLRNHVLTVTPQIKCDNDYCDMDLPGKIFFCEDELSEEDKKKISEEYSNALDNFSNELFERISKEDLDINWNYESIGMNHTHKDFKKYMKKPNCD